MENVSKVFLISAGVLIALMVLAIMIRMFDAGASISETVDAAQITRQQELYNSKFEVFDKPDNNIIDIVSAMNLAYSINEDSDYDSSVAVQILVKMGSSKTFEIPSEESKALSGRNKVLDGTNEIAIYELLNTPINELGISLPNLKNGEKLTESKLQYNKKKTYYKTTYKYLFESDPEQFEYNPITGKVSKIVFTAYYNSQYDEEFLPEL